MTTNLPSEDTTEVTLDGFLTKRIGSSHKTKNRTKNFKYYYFNLIGGSLHYYKEIDDVEPKATIHLKGLKLTPDVKIAAEVSETGFGFTLSNDKHEYLFFVDEQNEYKEWISKLSESLTKEPSAPLNKEKKKKKMLGALARAKKNVGGKLATTSVGKSILKLSIPEEVSNLINAFHKICEKTMDPKQATELEKAVVKLGVKTFFLLDSGEITLQQILEVDKPFRFALDILCKAFDHAKYSRRVNRELLQEKMKIVETNFQESSKLYAKMLTSHIKPKNLALIHSTTEVVAQADFLLKILLDETLTDYFQELITAAQHYTQFHFYADNS